MSLLKAQFIQLQKNVLGFFCYMFGFNILRHSWFTNSLELSLWYPLSTLTFPLGRHTGDVTDVRMRARPCMESALGYICLATLVDWHMGLYDSLTLCLYSQTP